MGTNWKHLATTKGYKSLKAAYIHDVIDAASEKHPMRNKAEFIRKFNWVIGRALHYANNTGRSVEAILNEWEQKRDYWWLNYYQDCRQPKFHSNGIKTMGVRGKRKYYKSVFNYSPAEIASSMRNFINKKSKKSKPSWPMARKKRGY